MRATDLAGRILRFGLRVLAWATGRRYYPWHSTPLHQAFAVIARRAYGRTGALYRALYAVSGALLKFSERAHGDRINFSARVSGAVDAGTLSSAALWLHGALSLPEIAPRTHINVHVHEGAETRIDRLLSLLLLSERVGSVNLFFDGEAAAAARIGTLTLAEERRGWAEGVRELSRAPTPGPEEPDDARWSMVYSERTGFDHGANAYLKLAHPGAFVVALALPEDEDGFCDAALPAWREAIQAVRWPIDNLVFVVLNRVGPHAGARPSSATGPTFACAQMSGLTFSETLSLARRADAYVGPLNVFGLAARAAKRPAVYCGPDPHAPADPGNASLHVAEGAPADACARLRDLLTMAPERRGGLIGRLARFARPRAKRAQAPLAGRYTVLVPTFERPALLERLLGWLGRSGHAHAVLVLDSSLPAVQEQNRRAVGRLALARHLSFPPEMDPYVKMREGLRSVDTAYCSICADDDMFVPSAVQQCLEALEEDPAAVLAHGYYFNFSEAQAFNLSYVVYRGRSVDEATPLARLRSQFSAYEAVLYGVFRTPMAQRVFRDVDRIDSVLGKELLTAALTVALGKTLRIPEFYYGRCTGDSLLYTRWHPHQILAEQPQALFAEHPVFRELLIRAIGEAHPGANAAAAGRSIDLILLRYLEPYLRKDVLDAMIDMSVEGRGADEIVAKVWDVFVRGQRRTYAVEPLLDADGAFLPDRFGANRARDYRFQARAWNGHERTYMVFYEFLFPEMRPPALVSKAKLGELLKTLEAF
jgi:glycosyltransferase domain-containing protein